MNRPDPVVSAALAGLHRCNAPATFVARHGYRTCGKHVAVGMAPVAAGEVARCDYALDGLGAMSWKQRLEIARLIEKQR